MTADGSVWRRLNPSVPRRALPAVAGGVWLAVALMLLARATIWLLGSRPLPALAAAAGGVAMAWFLVPRAFVPLVEKNLRRLAARPERACVFSTLALRSWILVVVMVVGGITLRRSSIPRLALAVPYLGMGLCLGAGAVAYLRRRSAWPS